MAPQSHIPLAANVLGTLGTVFWCIQLIPQIWQNWRRKKTEGVPALMLLLWAISAVPFGVYAVVQNFNIPIQIQPQIWGTLSLVTWAQILMYTSKWPTWKAVGLATGLFIIFAGVEAALIITLRGPDDRGVEWPMILVGSLAASILIIGITPPYIEIWKRRGRVVGINFLGAVFSLFALVAQEHFDILGGVLYNGVIILEAGIFISHVIWLFRTRELRKRAKLEGIHFDDLPEARRWQWSPTEKNERSSAASLDVETGDTSTDQVIAETRAPVPRDSELERIAQLKEVEKRQSTMTASDAGSADALEATRLKKAGTRKSVKIVSDSGFSEGNDSVDCGEKTAELLKLEESQRNTSEVTPEMKALETFDEKCDDPEHALHDLQSAEGSPSPKMDK